MAFGMGAVVLLFFGYTIHYLMLHAGELTPASFLLPFYNPKTFSWAAWFPPALPSLF